VTDRRTDGQTELPWHTRYSYAVARKNELFSFATVSFTRGHSVVNACAFHFSNRVINDWISLNYSQVHACSIAASRGV